MDHSLGRFTSPDSIVPTSTQGTQAWDRYAFVNNNPVRYTDPTGHCLDSTDYACRHSSDQAGNIQVVIAFGSQGKWERRFEPGPDCVEGSGEVHMGEYGNPPSGYVTQPVTYPGDPDGNAPNAAKEKQAEDIGTRDPSVLICYSAGVDACLIYAALHPESVTNLVLIGGGYGADYGGQSIEPTTGQVGTMTGGFEGIMSELHTMGVNILLVSDSSNPLGGPDNLITGYSPAGPGGKFQSISVSPDHFDVDGNTSLAAQVWNWITNPQYYIP